LDERDAQGHKYQGDKNTKKENQAEIQTGFDRENVAEKEARVGLNF
jgi:hypothetical protein